MLLPIEERNGQEITQGLRVSQWAIGSTCLGSDALQSVVRTKNESVQISLRRLIVTVHLYMPQEYVGVVMTLANQKRGIQMNMAYKGRQVVLTYEMPLAEIVLDFFDKLKSVSRGYASMDYEFKEYRAADVVKVDILL